MRIVVRECNIGDLNLRFELNQKDKYPKDLIKAAAGIKGIFCDVDGVLTDGRILYDESGREAKQFNIRDGRIISFLKKAGIVSGVVSAHESETVNRHCAALKMDFCHQGILDKVSAVTKLAQHYGLKLKEIAFIGDDLTDLPVFRIVGIGACPNDSRDYIKREADMVTHSKGGGGVMREVADLVLAARGELEKIINSL